MIQISPQIRMVFLRHCALYKNCNCLSNAMYSSIGQNIKSSAVSGVRCPTHFCVCVRALSRSQFLTDFDEIWHRRLKPKSRHDPWKKFAKMGRVKGHVTLNFLALNAHSSKMAKDANLKFGMHDPR